MGAGVYERHELAFMSGMNMGRRLSIRIQRAPLFASNRDFFRGDGSGLIHVVQRRDPRAT
jgi:hypothetical protein